MMRECSLGLTFLHPMEIERCLAVVGGDHQAGPYSGAVHLQVQEVMGTDRQREEQETHHQDVKHFRPLV